MKASCAACGNEQALESKFCMECGQPMESKSEDSEAPPKEKAEAPRKSASFKIPKFIPSLISKSMAMLTRILGSAVGFAVLYSVLMAPTYILPYTGSNSFAINSIAAAAGWGLMPQTWAHIWFLAMLILIAWMRGTVINKKFLPALALCAALFDMIPMLSAIPIVPTVFHIITLVLGVRGVSAINDDEDLLRRTGLRVFMVGGVTTLAAFFGTVSFLATASKSEGRYESRNYEYSVKAAKPSNPFRKSESNYPSPTTSEEKPDVQAENESNPYVDPPKASEQKPIAQAQSGSKPDSLPPKTTAQKNTTQVRSEPKSYSPPPKASVKTNTVQKKVIKPKVQTIDAQYAQRAKAECNADNKSIINMLANKVCQEKLRLTLCQNRWSANPRTGELICKSINDSVNDD